MERKKSVDLSTDDSWKDKDKTEGQTDKQDQLTHCLANQIKILTYKAIEPGEEDVSLIS
jgi:hypothetical protein